MSKAITISFSTLEGLVFQEVNAEDLRAARERIRLAMKPIVRANEKKLAESKAHTAKAILNR